MADGTARPVIFISYSHKDEPEHPREGEVQWLSFVRTYLQPAIKNGICELFVDEHLSGGTDLKPEIERKLRACDIFIPLISANSTASDYIVDTEIKIAREREASGDEICLYPLLLTPTPKIALDKFTDKVVRPRDARPLSSFPYGERLQKMTEIVDEIAKIAAEIISRKPEPPKRDLQPSYVHITGLPETPYERLVGRDGELKRLDQAWNDPKTNTLSLVAEGGAGKSALVNEWLKRLQAENYRGAEAVLGWSFYSQGTKERATSADEFLNWALEGLGVKLETTSASTKGEAVAEEMMKRRVLLVLDGLEPLQHGLDTQLGQLKDQGLRALLRRFAAMPPTDSHGLIVLTSRLTVKDIARWQDSSAPIEPLDKLLDDAGAALLRDSGLWGTDAQLKAAAHDFGGHPLALGLLASFLSETQTGDVRRRDHIRALLADIDNPGHDHAKRVMESYEKEWLASHHVLLAIMHMVGLFDRPASGDCLKALRAEPAIEGLTDQIVALDEIEWQRAITRLREVRLLAPPDPSTPDALDAHPLVREWFGERLRQIGETAWKHAHGRIYEHLRDTTNEGSLPSLENLSPLYQAIAHGCSSNRYREALRDIYRCRICRDDFYTKRVLGAFSSDLAAVARFFERPFEEINSTLTQSERAWVLGEAAVCLKAQGRYQEAKTALRTDLRLVESQQNWVGASIVTVNLSDTHLELGEIGDAIAAAERSMIFSERLDQYKEELKVISRATCAAALYASGRRHSASESFVKATLLQRKGEPNSPLYSGRGYNFCILLLEKGGYAAAYDYSHKIVSWIKGKKVGILDITLGNLGLARAAVALLIDTKVSKTHLSNKPTVTSASFDRSVDGLRSTGSDGNTVMALLPRAAFRRNIGDWEGATRDLDEVEEIAESGPMRLYLCDMALERARHALAKIEAFAPLNGMLERENPPRPTAPSADQVAELKGEANNQTRTAADYINECGYHRRDEELAELQAVLRGEKNFADLPPRV